MKGKMLIFAVIAVFFVLGISGYAGYRYLFSQSGNSKEKIVEDEAELLPPVAGSVKVTVGKHPGEANTVLLSVSGLEEKYQAIAYEVTYESEGLIKGVNSGSKPLDVSGKADFERDIYLGTCSKNVCRADTGVTSVSVTLEFTGTDGKRSQFTGDFDL